MNGQTQRHRAPRPWHLWVVAIAVLALYLGGARDYLLLLVGDTEYMQAQFGTEGSRTSPTTRFRSVSSGRSTSSEA